MKRTNQVSLLSFFSKKDRPKSNELLSKDNVESCHIEEVEINRAGPSTDTDDDEVKKGKSLIYFIRKEQSY